MPGKTGIGPYSCRRFALTPGFLYAEKRVRQLHKRLVWKAGFSSAK